MSTQDPSSDESQPTPEAVLGQVAQLLDLLAPDLRPLGLAADDVKGLLLKLYAEMAAEAQGGKDDQATTCAGAIATELSRHRVHQLRAHPQDPAALRSLAQKLKAAISILES